MLQAGEIRKSRLGFPRFTVLILLMAPLSFAGLSADSIYLRNGKRVDCAIRGQNRTIIRCRTASGKILKISKRKIRRVTYGKSESRAARIALARKKREEKRLAALRRAETAKRAEETKRLAALKRAAALRRTEPRKETRRTRTSADARAISPLGATWRTLLLPGWGQVARGDTWRGIGLGTGFFLAAAGAASFRSTYESTRRTYDESARNALLIGQSNGTNGLLFGETTVSRNQHAMDTAASGFQAATGLLAVIYIYSVVDAYFFTNNAPGPRRPSYATETAEGLRLHLDADFISQGNGNTRELFPMGERLGVSFTLRF